MCLVHFAIQEYLVFAVVAFILSVYLSVEYYSVRTIVLDTANDHYSVYRGTMLTATQHCHNIFIRLLSKSTGTGKNTLCTVTGRVQVLEYSCLTGLTLLFRVCFFLCCL